MSLFNSTSAQDLVCILDNDNLQQIFTATSPIRVSVRESKKATQFAVEDGSERSDHVVTAATEISFDLFIRDEWARNGYEEIRQAWRENRLVTVQTSVSSYPDMLILDIPHDETQEGGGSIRIPVRMQEWRTYEPQYGELPPAKVKNKNQSSTVQAGQKQTSETSEATRRRGSVLFGVLN